MEQKNIRNFCIIAHIDHGKSTLADRFLELTKTIDKRQMKAQLLDSMALERERGITIKLTPVRMRYRREFDRRQSQRETRNGAEPLLYEDLTYKIRGAVFAVRKELGLGHKESAYHQALEREFRLVGLPYESEQRIPTMYKGERVGTYTPDFVIDGKILVELKALPEVGKPQQEQIWSYLKGSSYKLALLINFGSTDIDIQRIVYDTVRFGQRDSALRLRESAQIEEYTLNLIDTPGHADFSYEVSRSLAAVEGALLLIDATQGVQAQTLANLHFALEQNLEIIPVLNKIDLPNADTERVAQEVLELLGGKKEDILFVSAKTGEGVLAVLDRVIERISAPSGNAHGTLRALIFDSLYDSYRGVVAYVRVVDGAVAKGDRIRLFATGKESEVLEVGVFAPEYSPKAQLAAGEIGYIVTGLKDLASCRVGDTITNFKFQISNSEFKPLLGYKEVKPMVFAGFFPEEADAIERLREAVQKLQLNDAAFSFEPEHSQALGFGFRCGFLGLLHLDIIRERLLREHDISVIVTVPSVRYEVTKKNGDVLTVHGALELPDPSSIHEIREPWVRVDIITPDSVLGTVMQCVQDFRGVYVDTEYLGHEEGKRRALLHYEMPLSQILIDFYDRLKSVSQGYASLNYEFLEYRPAEVVRLDILVAEHVEESLATIVYTDDAYTIGRRIVEKLKASLPKQWFEIKLQAALGGKIIAAERLSALRKDVTAKLYGGDVTRKRKLLEKQKKGKKKMAEHGRGSVAIPPETYLAILKR